MLLFLNSSFNYLNKKCELNSFIKSKCMIKGELFSSISPYLISDERWNIIKLRPSSVEPMTLSKYVAEYE